MKMAIFDDFGRFRVSKLLILTIPGGVLRVKMVHFAKPLCTKWSHACVQLTHVRGRGTSDTCASETVCAESAYFHYAILACHGPGGANFRV